MNSITKGIVGGLIAGAATFAVGEAFMHTAEQAEPTRDLSNSEGDRQQMIIATAIVIGGSIGAVSFVVSLYREPEPTDTLPKAF